MTQQSFLPAPKEEVYTSWAIKGAIGLGVGTAFWLLGPKLLAGLTLLNNIFASGISATILAIILLVLVSAFPKIIDLCEQVINVIARKLAWWVWEWDPIEPLRQGLAEVQRDGLEFKHHLDNLSGVQANVEQKRDAFIGQATDAEEKALTFHNKGQDSQFQSFSYAHGQYKTAADKFQKMADDIGNIYNEIKHLYDLYKAEEGKLKVDIDVQQNLWETSISTGGALDMADKMLTKSSKKRRFAEEVRAMIEQKYAGNIGRLRSLKTLSGDLIASFDADKGKYSEQLLKKWNSEKTLLLEDKSNTSLVMPMKVKDSNYV